MMQSTKMMRLVCLLIALTFLALPEPWSSVHSQDAPPSLDIPVDCTVGEDCWLVNFVDRTPGPGATDFRCGSKTYDTHKGTDIALANLAAMRKGVPVLAAADGVVIGTRDGMPNTRRLDLTNAQEIRGRECGNGVVIDHGNGWRTQYCHLQANTLTISRNSKVRRGDVIGLVGMSGRTEFPHVHMSVQQGDTVIDPFTGQASVSMCDSKAPVEGLWSSQARSALAYPGAQIYHFGFAPERPDVEKVRAGGYLNPLLDRTTPAIVFWAEAFGLEAGDVMRVALTVEGGRNIADNSVAIERTRARQYIFAGARRPTDGWEPGTIRGEVTVTRGKDVIRRFMTTEIE